VELLHATERPRFGAKAQGKQRRRGMALLLSQLAAVGQLDDDLLWRDDPRAWHQQLARIVDHRFSTLDELVRFAREAKKAGVSALMLVQIQKTSACPGPWYNGLQNCEHINGSYPAADGSLERWRAMLDEIKPMRLMWWTNPSYWSVQGPVWSAAVADTRSDVGRWFSWGAENCRGIQPCMGRNVVEPGVGCAQGSWGSLGETSGVKSALASFGSSTYASHLEDLVRSSHLISSHLIVQVRRVHGRRDGHLVDGQPRHRRLLRGDLT
jgi:hypothetical protein